MGSFYGSMHIRTENSAEVRKALEDVAKIIECRFFLGPPVSGWISVFPNHRGQSEKPAIETSRRLSYDIFHLIVHDDVIFLYYFFRGGQLVDRYNSCPDYFNEVSSEEKQRCRGHAELFQDLLGKPESLKKLKALLGADGYDFEQERMREFVKLLGLPNAVSNYEFLDAGKRDGIKGWKQFIHIPDLRAANRAAQGKIKAEKRRLQKHGLLLAEMKPASGADPSAWRECLSSNGFIVTPVGGKEPVINIKGLGAARGTAVHPSGKFAVLNLQGEIAVIDLKKKKLHRKFSINRRMETIDPFARDSKGIMAHACLKNFLKKPEIREQLGVDAQAHAAIVQDPKAVEKLPGEIQQKIKTLLETVRQRMRRTMETREQVFDVCFNPNGEQLFIASKGMRVYDWNTLLSAAKGTPPPDFSVDAPIDDEADPNSQPLAYCVRFDSERNLLLSGCLAGVVQFLNVKNGQSGTLLTLPGEVTIWRLELTDDRSALCCYCSTRLKRENLYKQEESFLQVWNYRALCEAAGLTWS